MRIVYFVADGHKEYNSSNWRVTMQANALGEQGLAKTRILMVREWIQNTDLAVETCHWADVIVIQRVMFAESIARATYWTELGKPVVVDFDDAYDLIRPDNSAYKFWGEGIVTVTHNSGAKLDKHVDSHPVEQFRVGLGICRGGTTPGKQLVHDWSKYGNIFWLPNYLETWKYPQRDRQRDDSIIIGWGGSLSHIPSFTDSGVIEGLNMVLRNHTNVFLLIVGDKRVLEHLSGLPKGRVIFQPYVKYYKWPQTINKFTIGIAPLAGPYDARRSWIKPAEYMAAGMRFVATRSVVYEDLVDIAEGRGEFVDQGALDMLDKPNPEGWANAIERAIKLRKAPVDEGLLDKLDVKRNAHRILEVYERIANA